MSRTGNWVLVCFIGVVAIAACLRPDQIARRLGILDAPMLRKPPEYAI